MPCSLPYTIGEIPPYATEKDLTILREPPSPEIDPQALALSALGWVLSDEQRADRFLSLTGLTPDELRSGLGDPGQLSLILVAVLDYLAGHEGDLISAAEALGITPPALLAAKQGLQG